MRVVIAGSSGFLGTNLRERLKADGHDVIRLVRSADPGPGESSWDPYAGRIDESVIDAADAVINLCGTPVLGNPHSTAWARRLRDSRVISTRVLAQTIAVSAAKPTLINASGINVYGEQGATELTEDSASLGDALLTRVCREWEKVTEAAASAGSRVCLLRTAPVIDRTHPPLSTMMLPFRLGLGAYLGDGTAYFPIISLRDWVGAVVFMLEHDTADGPANLCCPRTPTNAEYSDALATALGRTVRLRAPAKVLRTAAGALAPELLGSLNAQPAALTGWGYEFADRDATDILATALR